MVLSFVIRKLLQCNGTRKWMIQFKDRLFQGYIHTEVKYAIQNIFAPIFNKLHAMLFAANVNEFILLSRISSLGKRKQFYDSKYSQFGMRLSVEFV